MDEIKKHNMAKKVAIGVAGGAAAAGASAMYKTYDEEVANLKDDSVYTNKPESDIDNAEEFTGESYSLEEYMSIQSKESSYAMETDTDGQIQIPDLDKLSFSEAFKKGREAVGGGGGVFQWHGNYYNTYIETEYNNLSQTEMDELFATYMDAVNGNTEKLCVSLKATIESCGSRLSVVDEPNVDLQADTYNEDIYDISKNQNESEDDIDDPKDELEDENVESDENEELDFDNLYT